MPVFPSPVLGRLAHCASASPSGLAWIRVIPFHKVSTGRRSATPRPSLPLHSSDLLGQARCRLDLSGQESALALDIRIEAVWVLIRRASQPRLRVHHVEVPLRPPWRRVALALPLLQLLCHSSPLPSRTIVSARRSSLWYLVEAALRTGCPRSGSAASRGARTPDRRPSLRGHRALQEDGRLDPSRTDLAAAPGNPFYPGRCIPNTSAHDPTAPKSARFTRT